MTNSLTRSQPGKADPRSMAAVEVTALVRTFGSHRALDGVDLSVAAGEIHAVLGPNGAGKTTLLRTLIGLVEPTSGSVRLLGHPVARLGDRRGRGAISLVPSGDRTFYLRLSGLENLIFFARLLGLRPRQARTRAMECLVDVGLRDSARRPVGLYSHGMQKRLSVARAILSPPKLLLVDEATHDLDPDACRRVQELVSQLARGGTAVLWATQRLDEIRGFADHVTVLRGGRARFTGTVTQLLAMAAGDRYVVRVRPAPGSAASGLLERSRSALAGRAEVSLVDGEHLLLSLSEDAVLGALITDLTLAGLDVLTCREERSEVETAFLALVRSDAP